MKNKKFAFSVLIAAALYNLVWGVLVVSFPNLFFDLAGLPRPLYPEIWQCVGMIVGVYGIGYAAAAFDPVRFWPIILVGFLGKVLGPVGFAKAIHEGTFNWLFGVNIVFNDLVWWIPFVLILKGCAEELQKPPYDSGENIDLAEELKNFQLNGTSLWKLSEEKPLYLKFVRHTGCTFARKELSEHAGEDVLVHMAKSEPFPFSSIADPGQRLYRACKIGRASWRQVFGPQVIWSGIKAFLLEGHFVGPLEGDGFQLAGKAVIKNGKLINSQTASDATGKI